MRIDNGAQPSALSIVPRLQAVARGDVMPAIPGAKDAFVGAVVDPPHDLVLTAPDGDGGEAVSGEPAGFREVRGHVNRGLETVREAFVENFARTRELGGACCAYHHAEKVVDLWGGVRNKLTGELWEQDTMVLVYSATKGLAAMTLALAHSRGWLDYEERVVTYWPEFAQKGKEKITSANS